MYNLPDMSPLLHAAFATLVAAVSIVALGLASTSIDFPFWWGAVATVAAWAVGYFVSTRIVK